MTCFYTTAIVCTQANPGFSLSNGAPFAATCATGCTTCSSPTNCSTASSGYFLNNNVPAACATNCT